MGETQAQPQGAPSLTGETGLQSYDRVQSPVILSASAQPYSLPAKVFSAACQSRPCRYDGPKWLGTCPCLRSTGPKVGLALEMNGYLSHHWEKSCGEAEPKITELCSQSRWSTRGKHQQNSSWAEFCIPSTTPPGYCSQFIPFFQKPA